MSAPSVSNVWRMFCASALFVFAATSLAEGNPNISNIGFMENPPKELKEKFPMCDAFLKVEWIDKEKKIGYSNYEAIIKTKEGKFKGKKTVWALVDMEVRGIDYDVYQYKKQGRLEEVFDMVRNGKVTIGIPMMINYKGESIALYGGKTVNYDALHPLLSDHYQTVCVAYPDEQRAWIIEGKNVKQIYTKEQIDDLSKKANEAAVRLIPRERIEALWILDINYDGIDDYFHQGGLLYSHSDHYFWWEKNFKYPNFKFTVPTSNRACYLKRLGGYSLTTDGKNYYFENQCNLTELTSPSNKEQENGNR